MREALEQGTIQCARLSLVLPFFFGFFRSSNQLVESLGIASALVQKIAQRFGVGQQGIPPLFRLVMHPFFFLIETLDSMQLRLQAFDLGISHALADKLQLAASGFMFLRGQVAVKLQRLFEVCISEFYFCKLLVRQLGELFAQRLQRMHFTFDRTFRGGLIEGFLVVNRLFKGASVCHGH